MQQYSGQLRSVTVNTGVSGTLAGANVEDIAVASSNIFTQTSSWSPGAYIVDPIALQPQIAAPWNVYAWNLSFQGFLAEPGGGGGYVPFGRLGQVWGGLVIGGPSTNPPGSFPWVNPLTSLPTPNVGITLIWDGSTDATFPYVGTTNAAQAFQYSLPQPLQLNPGEQLFFGIWLTPMIGQNVSLYIANAAYGILYDLGQPQPITTP